jgi:hypothetical protein
MPSSSHTSARELAHRYADGVHVTLLWYPRTDRVVIEVFDEKNEKSFEFEAPAARALDAFWHPYAYAAFAGLEVSLDEREPAGV